MTPPLFLSRAPPIRSTIRHSQSFNHQGDCHLEPRHRTTVPGFGSATVDATEPQCLKSSTGDRYSVSVPEALQLPSCPIIPAPLPTCNSGPADYLSGEPATAQVAQSSGYVAGQNRASSTVSPTCINDSPSVDHTVATESRRVTPPTISRTMTPLFPHHTQIFYHLML
ncbi:hypothetical protein PISMIDRAFT_689129 [Pisolithus microcarpus 441]|uniref:Uncharacterized protein n=1 Tax=Pisolithus microcarpus 441 TaxID=765257 RepID=A0A0C9YY52_9AGAM|nr:hypothetical protein BKA83DRAFT_689129 [Pisolithus microcarpus]KIK12853.1 hypothetical protein PISMIDRAFT_689129 [Pisolithus microcarpus 441]